MSLDTLEASATNVLFVPDNSPDGYMFTKLFDIYNSETVSVWEVSTCTNVKLGQVRIDSESSFVTVIGFYGLKRQRSPRQVYRTVRPVKFSTRLDAADALRLAYTSLRSLTESLQDCFESIEPVSTPVPITTEADGHD